MRTFGLIGFPLSHSFSPAYFAAKFREEAIDAAYHLYLLEDVAALPQLLHKHPGIAGLNVTIPHKEGVIPFLDAVSAEAKEIGAVNCIKITDGRTVGYNTDAAGFKKSLLPLLQQDTKQALILGTGGASLAVAYVLRSLGIPYRYVSRNSKPGAVTYEELDDSIIHSHTLIINTTPVGMYPDTAMAPAIPYQYIGQQHILYDLIYNPAETLFLKEGKQRGAVIKNGLEMLELQAEASWEIWNS